MPRSADDLRFELPSKELEQYAWEHNEHIHGSLTPLAQDMSDQRASSAPDGSPMSVFVNGYSYTRPFGGFRGGLPDDAERVLGWADVWLPRIAGAAEQLEQFDPASVAASGLGARGSSERSEHRFGNDYAVASSTISARQRSVNSRRWSESDGRRSPRRRIMRYSFSSSKAVQKLDADAKFPKPRIGL